MAQPVVPAADSSGLELPSPGAYTGGYGGAVVLTNYGFGLGGLVRLGLGPGTSFVAELRVGVGKDEREQEFFVGPVGDTVTPFKRSRFLMAPLEAGVERRLFREAIEDDFRPFVQLLGGLAFGYQWPYFDDDDGDGIRSADEERRSVFDFAGGEARLGLSGTVALGAFFGEAGRPTLGLRIGYTAAYFFEPVELLEPRPTVAAPSRRYFGTPLVTLYFVRLL